MPVSFIYLPRFGAVFLFVVTLLSSVGCTYW